MSIEYSKQKINPAVIIIVNFHKFNFECFWLDDSETSTKALNVIYYTGGLGGPPGPNF